MRGHIVKRYTKRYPNSWTITIELGNDPATGSGTNEVMTQTNNAVLTWLWTTNYQLTSSSAGNGAVGGSTNGFYGIGSPVSVTATPSLGYYFAGWTGDTAAGNTSNPTLNLTMDQARSVVAHFALSQETLTIVSAHGTGTPPVGVYTNGYGSVLTNTISGVQIVGGTQYVATGWTLTGTMTIANNTWREFVVTLNTLTTATLQNVAVGTFS